MPWANPGFNQDLADQILPGADDLGKEVGERIRAGIQEALEGISVKINVDDAQADATMDGLQARKDKLAEDPADLKFGADGAEASAVMDDLQAEKDKLAAEATDINLDADPAEALSAVELVQAKLDELQREVEGALALTIDGTPAEAVLKHVQGQLDALQERHDEIALNIDSEDAEAQLSYLDKIVDQLAVRLAGLQEAAASAAVPVEAVGAASAAAAPEMDVAAASAAAEAAALRDLGDAGTKAEPSATGLAATIDFLRSELGDAGLGDAITARKIGLNEFSVAAGDADDALAKLGNQAGDTGRSLGGLSGSGGGGGAGGGGAGFMGVLLGAAVALGPALITAGAAEALFAGAAIPDIKLIADNTGLFKAQLSGVKTEYQQLNAAVMPEVLSDFDIAVTQAKDVIPEFTGAAQAGGRALGGFEQQFGHFLQSSDTKGFLAFVSQEAGGDLHAFGDLLQGAATAGQGFAESLNGVSRDAINAAGGILSFTGEALKDVPLLGPLAAGAVAVGLGFAKIPGILESISGSNFSQWLTGSKEGLASLGPVFTEAAAAGDAAMAEIAAKAAVLDTQFGVLASQSAELEASLTALAAGGAEGFDAELAGLSAEITGVDAEMAALEAELVGLDAEMAATSAEGGILAGVMGVLDAVNPLAWAGIAAVGVALLTDKMVTGASVAQTYYDVLAEQAGATGDNVQADENFAKSMQDGGSAAQALTGQLQQQTEASSRFGVATQVSATQTQQLTEAQKEASAQVLIAQAAQGQLSASQLEANQATAAYGSNLQTLGAKYGLTTQGAIRLADGAKVSASALSQTGVAGEAAMNKVEAYAAAGAKASSQTVQFAVDMALAGDNALTLQARVTALTTALNSESGGTDTAISAAVQFQQSLTTLQQDMSASGDKAGYLTKQGQATALALSQADSAAKAASEGILQTGGSASQAAGPLEQLRSEMEKIQDPTSAEKLLLQQLNAEIAALQSKTITITVNEDVNAAEGGADISGVTTGGRRITSAASGWYVSGGTPGKDSVPILGMPGELMVPVPIVEAGEVDHLRGRIPGFAAGGVVGATASGSGDAIDFSVVMNILADAGSYSTSKTGVDDADKLATEFADGTLKTVTEIRDAGTQAITALKDYYTGPHQQELVSAMSKQVTALDQLAARSSTIATEIANMKSYAAQETSSLSGFADLSTVTGATQADGSTAPVTSSDISSALAQDLATLKQFVAVIKQLQAAKVDKTLINQVIALGPTQGVVYGQAILAAGPALIKQLNADESQIASAETTVGQEAADVQYGVSIGTGVGKGFLASLEKQQSAIKKEMATYGDAIAEELEKALHGKVKLAPVTAAQVAAATSAASGTAASVGGTLGTASATAGPSAAQMARLIAAADTTDDSIRKLATAAQMSQLIAQVKALPKAEAAAIGPTVASALNGVAQKAAQAARTNTR